MLFIDVDKKVPGPQSKLFGLLNVPLKSISLFKGTADYMGINHYSTRMVKDREDWPIGTPRAQYDRRVTVSAREDWPSSPITSLLRVKQLMWTSDLSSNCVLSIGSSMGTQKTPEVEQEPLQRYYIHHWKRFCWWWNTNWYWENCVSSGKSQYTVIKTNSRIAQLICKRLFVVVHEPGTGCHIRRWSRR